MCGRLKALAVAILLSIICSSCSADEVAEVPEPSEAPFESEEETAAVASAESTEPGGQQLIVGDDQLISTGSYRSESTGVPFVFEVDREWTTFSVGPGHLVLADPDVRDRGLSFIRPSELSSPSAPGESPEAQLGWPIDDIEGWLENVIDGVFIGDVESVELGGRPAIRFTAEVTNNAACGQFGEYCAAFVTNHFSAGWTFELGFRSTVYWVDMGADLAPLAVLFGSRADDDNWQQIAEGLLGTLEFGEPGPHPVSTDNVPLWEQGVNSAAPVPAGLRWFPTFGGFSFVLDEDRDIRQAGNYFLVMGSGDSQGDVEIWRAQSGPGGNPIESTDDLVGVLELISDSVDEVGSSTHRLGEARQFDVRAAGNTFDPDLSVQSEPGELWFTPSAARLWVFETDRGVIVVSAESFLQDFLLADMIELAERVILPTAELTGAR